MIVVWTQRMPRPARTALFGKPSIYKETMASIGRLRIKRLRKNGRAERLRKAK